MNRDTALLLASMMQDSLNHEGHITYLRHHYGTFGIERAVRGCNALAEQFGFSLQPWSDEVQKIIN